MEPALAITVGTAACAAAWQCGNDARHHPYLQKAR